ncbi:glycosyltransferase family 2 protein [Amycolatopsis nigrescens]|uniref:glycosyltransferase family 2 protein n=1 Tax=Amycolatopsis nigrescens TaxID=381445 RepID=UPI000476C901|nr:glycosyltransferase family 2 protein [Amycolatopsis nigrescens]
MPRTPAAPSSRTAPVLAVLVCHNGADWLPLALSALRRSTIRPRHILAVDTGSTDRTAQLLAEAADPLHAVGGQGEQPVLDGVLTLPAGTGFADAVDDAVAQAVERWGDPGAWVWLLHDDCAPEPDCLDILLRAVEAAPSAGVLGPLAVNWTDPRLIVEAGLSLDASGHRQSASPAGGALGDWEPDNPQQSTEVLAVPSAGALIQRSLWTSLDGFDRGFPLLGEDIDFGWRANAVGRLVLCVPRARLRHARALTTGRRAVGATSGSVAATERTSGLRVFLANCSAFSFWFGLCRLVVLCVLRGLGFALLRRGTQAAAEFAAVRYLTSGAGGLREARARRRALGLRPGVVRGLFTSRFTRLRNATRAGVLTLVRRRVASEAALGRLPAAAADESAWIPPEAMRHTESAPRPVGPDALPAGALRASGTRGAGLRRPGGVVAVALPDAAHGVDGADVVDDSDTVEAEETGAKPSPGHREGDGELVFVEVNRRRILSATLFAPPVVLFVLLTVLGLVLNGGRLGLELTGGRLLPVGGLGELWQVYLAPWHPIGGGTASSASAALPVLGVLGALFAPIGGPAALVAVLLIGDLPLAALTAYAATRKLRVHRWVRAGAAAAYALLPAATASVAQGRLDVVVAHILLPAVLAGIAGILVRTDGRWLHVSVLCALGVAVLGAFSPLAHALALLGLVAGFVALPAPGGLARRIASVGIIVLLPLALLLPWPTVLLNNPGLLLHGLSGPGAPATGSELFGLDPGGAGGLPIGIALVAAALVALVFRPTRQVAAGLGVVVLGVGGLVLVRLVAVPPLQGGPASGGFTGVPMLVIGAGLLWVVLATCLRDGVRAPSWLPRLGAAGGVAVLLVLAVGGVVAGREGPLRPGDGDQLASSLTAELANTGRSVLVLGSGGEPPRQTGGRLPRFGDEQLPLAAGTPDRLAGWQRDLTEGAPDAARQTLSAAAASGVLFVVMPPGVERPLAQAVPAVAGDAPPTEEGRQVLRLVPPGGQVVLIPPELARQAVTGQAPDEFTGVTPVPSGLPDVRVRVSDGPAGRLLVLSAEQEAGWQATVNGQRQPIVPAWGHQVAVVVPTRQAEVLVEHPSALRNVLLLGQVAAVLFTLLTAIPGRRVPARQRS